MTGKHWDAWLTISAAILVCGCADVSTDASGPQVVVQAAALTLGSVESANYTYVMDYWNPDANGGAGGWETVVATTPFTSAPNAQGGATAIATCIDGEPGPNGFDSRVTVSVSNVVVDGVALSSGELPPPQVVEFDCIENADVRVNVVFTVIADAQQGFADLAIDIDTYFCSAKVDCDPVLMHDANGTRGMTLITGFVCTGGDDAHPDQNLTFQAQLCCDDGAGGVACTAHNLLPEDPYGSADPADNPGVSSYQVFAGTEEVDDKIYHNTSWRLDHDYLAAPNTCYFGAVGWLTTPGTATEPAPPEDGTGSSYPGEGYPLIAWQVDVTWDDVSGRGICTGANVATSYSREASTSTTGGVMRDSQE